MPEPVFFVSAEAIAVLVLENGQEKLCVKQARDAGLGYDI